MKIRRYTTPPVPDPRQAVLWVHALTGDLYVTTPDGTSTAVGGGGGGGGGTSDHASLSHLSWTVGGHTATANRLAWFGSGGAADLLGVGSGLTVSGSSLVADTTVMAALAAVAAGYQPLDADLTALAAGTWAGTSALVTLGTITTGTWHGSTIGEAYGGTAQTTYTTGDLLYASASNTLSRLSIGSAAYLLSVVGGIPAWRSPANIRTDLALVIGTNVQAWDQDLDALAALSSTGILARTAANTYQLRTFVAGTGMSITYPDGVGGNPVFAASGSTNTDLDPTTGYMAEFWPGGGGSIRSMETVGVRGGSATGNTSTQKRTKFTGGAVAADFYSTVTIRADQNPVIKMRFWTGPSLAATLRHKHGLTTYTGWTTTDTEAASSKFVMLRYSTGKGDTTWKLVTNDGTTETVTDTTVTPATNTEYTVTITYSGNGTLITCVVNGTSCSTSTALPAATTEFATFACGVYGTTSAREWYHVGAYVRVAYP